MGSSRARTDLESTWEDGCVDLDPWHRTGIPFAQRLDQLTARVGVAPGSECAG